MREQFLGGYEGRIDYVTLHTDPVIQRAADRSPEADDLARLIALPVHYRPDEAGTAMPAWSLRAPVPPHLREFASWCSARRHIDRGTERAAAH